MSRTESYAERLDLDQAVAAEFRTPDFHVRPIVAADAEWDYAAVMDTREALRLWRQSDWPEDHFTVAENLRDLVEMEERHLARRAFNYTVLDASDSECQGCVYVYSTGATFLADAQVTPLGSGSWSDLDAVVFFWARRSVMDSGADRRLLAALRAWFDGDLKVEQVVFITSETFDQQVALFRQSGLRPVFELRYRGAPGKSLAFG